MYYVSVFEAKKEIPVQGGKMKRIAWLLVLMFGAASFLFASDKNNSHEMTGWICNAKCVDQSSGMATCNKNCSETSGDVVFINEKGKVYQISNQPKAQPMSGKKCKMKAKMDPDTGTLSVDDLVELRAGG